MSISQGHADNGGRPERRRCSWTGVVGPSRPEGQPGHCPDSGTGRSALSDGSGAAASGRRNTAKPVAYSAVCPPSYLFHSVVRVTLKNDGTDGTDGTRNCIEMSAQ